MGFRYFIKNFLKVLGLAIAVGLLQTYKVDFDGNFIFNVFLFVLLFATVTTTFSLGGGWFLEVTTGVGVGGAFLITFIIVGLSYATMSWVAEHIPLVTGILLAVYALGQIAQTIKYAPELPRFFTFTGGLCVVVFVVEAICAFLEKPTYFFAMDYSGIGGLFRFLMMGFTVIFTLVNIIARATKASYVED